MKEINTNSLDDFWETFRELEKEYPKGFCYRGQENSCWGLDTTLERIPNNISSVDSYIKKCVGASKIIESHESSGLEIVDSTEAYKVLRNHRENLGAYFVNMPNYEYLVYLRHHGFPSPFLDWTRSVYIALFFAFYKADEDRVDDVSVFMYSKDSMDNNTDYDKLPQTYRLGKYVRSHPRHFLQQADYTIAIEYNESFGGNTEIGSSNHYFVSHEKTIEENGENIYKINIPCSGKENVLEDLAEMNITEYSLFQTTDSLVSSVKREMFIR